MMGGPPSTLRPSPSSLLKKSLYTLSFLFIFFFFFFFFLEFTEVFVPLFSPFFLTWSLELDFAAAPPRVLVRC